MSLGWLVFNGLVFFQSALIVSGGAVRLTGSGLGCPTWPQCTGNSIKPIAHQAQGQIHAWIEFGNRLIAWVIFILAIIAIILVVKKYKDRTDFKHLRLLAIFQLLGFVGQVVLGGITVLTKLNPITVSAHFLLTIPLIAGAISLRAGIKQTSKFDIEATSKLVIRIVLVLTLIVLFIGTLVTGTGPHAGDIQAKRYPFDERTISWIHADAVIALIVMVIALLLVVSGSKDVQGTKQLKHKIQIFLLICLSQGAIGYIQYFTKLPELLVGAHLVGATFTWIFAWSIYISVKKTNLKLNK